MGGNRSRAGCAAGHGKRWSRHDCTQPQLFALLVPRQSLKADYRGVVALVAGWAELRRALGLREVPHHSTLAHAPRWILAGAEAGGLPPTPKPRWPDTRASGA